MAYWLLTREVCRLKDQSFSELIDLFMYRNLEAEKEKEKLEAEPEEVDADEEPVHDDGDFGEN
jgi:hypothetical protein